MDLHLTAQRALITGGSKGIGRAAAEQLAAEGCDIILVARHKPALDTVADDLRARYQVSVATIAADLSRESEVQRVAASAEFDILVNNAGAIPPGALTDIDNAVWRTAWDLKVFGYISLCRAAYAAMAARGAGVIVNIIGAAGEKFDPAYIAGSAGNAALMALTRALGKASHKDGIRVVGINPGPVATERMEMLQRARAKRMLGDAERWGELLAGMPFRRAATPEEIGAAVAFLASPVSGYTSGTILTINGGG